MEIVIHTVYIPVLHIFNKSIFPCNYQPLKNVIFLRDTVFELGIPTDIGVTVMSAWRTQHNIYGGHAYLVKVQKAVLDSFRLVSGKLILEGLDSGRTRIFL